MNKKKIIFFSLGLVFCILGLWAFWLEPSSLRTKEYPLKIKHWPEICRDLRIALLADLHTGSPYNGLDKLELIVKQTNEAKPDLILLAGDYVIQGVVGGRFVEPEAIAQVLSHLKAPLGVFGVLGNHDEWGDSKRIKNSFENVRIPILHDQAIKLAKGECKFWLWGISDFWEGAHDIKKGLKQITNDLPIIAFTHNPDVFPDVPAHVGLVLAGHTHGGQVYFPLIGRLIVPSKYGERYAIGHIVEGDKHLFVTPGIGTSIIPVRFLVPPEISIIQLNRDIR